MSGAFDLLSPSVVVEAVESAFDMRLDGSLQPYSSYVNRVYGLKDENGSSYIVKFYRPGRWSDEAILEEHRFLIDCRDAELSVVAPLSDASGSTLACVEVDQKESKTEKTAVFSFALFPRKGGRSFDAETTDDWLRLGALIGRLHAIGKTRSAPHRPRLDPALAYANLEIVTPLVHPEFSQEFSDLCKETLERTAARISSLGTQRIHGDLHRGNLLSRLDEGLLLLDFDDMMTGPPVQDLWLLLPGRTDECKRELSLLFEGYTEFSDMEPGSVTAIETLRFYRMLHFLAWRSLQREDSWFLRDYPDWGGRAFWIRELEGLREQSDAIGQE
jgi:Ser/Thr protein kinase RdoA (MazF antagonist)